jgi:alanine dehydrogenase
MRIGVPREVKDLEFRVGMVPDGARRLCSLGHELLVERGAGLGSGFADEAYTAAGARLVSRADAWSMPDLIVR